MGDSFLRPGPVLFSSLRVLCSWCTHQNRHETHETAHGNIPWVFTVRSIQWGSTPPTQYPRPSYVLNKPWMPMWSGYNFLLFHFVLFTFHFTMDLKSLEGENNYDARYFLKIFWAKRSLIAKHRNSKDASSLVAGGDLNSSESMGSCIVSWNVETWKWEWWIKNKEKKHWQCVLQYLRNDNSSFCLSWRSVCVCVLQHERNSLYFFVVVGFELRTLSLLGSCSTTWATPLVLATQFLYEFHTMHYAPYFPVRMDFPD
jgi:hypothetical protein